MLQFGIRANLVFVGNGYVTKHGKLNILCLGPSKIKEVVDTNSFYFNHLDEERL
jgi:hypothetical protein